MRAIPRVDCPSVLSLEENAKKTIPFLEVASRQIRLSRRQRRQPANRPIKGIFDFRTVDKICPATALILCSIYDVRQARGGDFQVYDYEEWKPAVKDTFTKIGFFSWLRFRGIDTPGQEQALPIEAFQSETEADARVTGTYLTKLITSFNKAREEVRTSKIEAETLKRVASAIIEAVENSVRHAYTPGTPKDLRRKWWIGGVSEPHLGEVKVMCYDAGVSIPSSIENSHLDDPHGVRQYVRKVFSRFLRLNRVRADDGLDHKRVEIAVKYLASSTRQEGAGKGLSHIASTINELPDGDIQIYSRRAYMKFRKDGKTISQLLPAPLPGTLIVWRISLNGAAQ